jgi:hypothetical protein
LTLVPECLVVVLVVIEKVERDRTSGQQQGPSYLLVGSNG